MAADSIVQGSTDTPLVDLAIGRYFDDVCRQHRDRPALLSVHQSVRLTYAQLKERVDRVAAGLLALGLEPGDRVGIWAPNCWEWLVTQYATAKAGLILVNINPAYRRAEAEYALNKVACKALIVAPAHRGTDYVAMLTDLAPELRASAPGELASPALPHLRLVVTLGDGAHAGCLPFAGLAAAANTAAIDRLASLAAQLRPEDAINIQFTSGTTGAPKGATLSHRNILNNGRFVGDAIRLTPDDKVCTPVPLYHCFGMVMANLGCLTHGACVVYPAEAFDPLAVLQAIDAEGCTALYGVPTMFIAVLNRPEFPQFDLRGLRTGIMAGSPCPVEVMRQVIDRMHMREVTIAYGMTETSPVSFQSSIDDPIAKRVSTVGRVQPHLTVKVVDAEGVVVPRGTPGELCTTGYSVMLGYWDQPAASAEVLRDGWMRTGDLAVIDAEGYGNIVGRIKDMVIRGGENIYPREIEEFLYRHPAVQDVPVVGLPDRKYGEELCACIVLKAGAQADEEDIRAFCRGQIAHYKIPRYVKFVDGFPTTVTGKVQKYRLRTALMEELGLVAERTA